MRLDNPTTRARATTDPRAPTPAKARQTVPNPAKAPHHAIPAKQTQVPTWHTWTSPQIVGAPNEGHNGRRRSVSDERASNETGYCHDER